MAASISKTTFLELPQEYELQLVSQLWQIKYLVTMYLILSKAFSLCDMHINTMIS